MPLPFQEASLIGPPTEDNSSEKGNSMFDLVVLNPLYLRLIQRRARQSRILPAIELTLRKNIGHRVRVELDTIRSVWSRLNFAKWLSLDGDDTFVHEQVEVRQSHVPQGDQGFL